MSRCSPFFTLYTSPHQDNLPVFCLCYACVTSITAAGRCSSLLGFYLNAQCVWYDSRGVVWAQWCRKRLHQLRMQSKFCKGVKLASSQYRPMGQQASTLLLWSPNLARPRHSTRAKLASQTSDLCRPRCCSNTAMHALKLAGELRTHAGVC